MNCDICCDYLIYECDREKGICGLCIEEGEE